MKAYTDLEQSKKLAEFLPIESADMYFEKGIGDNYKESFGNYADMRIAENMLGINTIPCWSLTALLDVLPFPQLSKDKLGSGKEGWMVSVYPDNCRYDSCWHDNPVDCCIEMIIKLHEQNIL